MKGKYEIEVYDNHIAYHLEIKRNITVIQGDSGTGKTQLIRMLEDYNRAGKSSGIVLRCEKECIVPNVMDWENYLRGAHEKIFFIDENTPYLRSKAFAEIVNHSDNYFVLICRDDLPQLAYSVEEIYGMQKSRDTQKYVSARRIYNELYHLYNVKEVRPITPDIVVTEDSNAGFDCFCELFPQKCISANGKSRITRIVTEAANGSSQVLAVVDGAAFGANMQEFVRKTRYRKEVCVLFAPESFEYLLLRAGIVPADRERLDQTYDYADSTEFASWEQFYTKYLSEITEGTIYQYRKQKLNGAYLTEGNIKKIKMQIPELIRI